MSEAELPATPEPKYTELAFNEEGQYVDAATGDLYPTTTNIDMSAVFPQSLIDQHYGGVEPTPPGSPIPPPPS